MEQATLPTLPSSPTPYHFPLDTHHRLQPSPAKRGDLRDVGLHYGCLAICVLATQTSHSRAAAIPGQPGCSAQATAGAKPRKRWGTEQDGSEGPRKRHGRIVPRVLCVGGGEADPASGQDQEAAAQEVAGAEELPPAALTGLPTTRGGGQSNRYTFVSPQRHDPLPGLCQAACDPGSRRIPRKQTCQLLHLPQPQTRPAALGKAPPPPAKAKAALLAVPGTPGIGSPASPHSKPSTPASCLNPCLGSDGGPTCNLEPVKGQQDGAQASAATDLACPLSEAGHTSGPKPLPKSVSKRVHRAEAVRQKLSTTRSEWDFALKPMSDAGSLYLLNYIAQPVSPGDWEEQDMDFVIPVPAPAPTASTRKEAV
ncbi:hypothetical protein V8C86DRAFT_2430835 [Haematococcus lacustris]